MHQTLFNISGEIEEAGNALSLTYSPGQLYALRVGIRRTRSILKHIGSHKSRSYRKTWGGFAAVTNDARDWDVFLITAEKLLTPGDYRSFEALNREQVQSSREAAVEMLTAAPWRRHLQEWKHHLGQTGEESSGQDQVLTSLERALVKARRALQLALTVDNDRRWHKFRIAVKEVRYVADSGRDHPAKGEYLAEVSATCRSVQTMLGDWHDTVVQLDILSELADTPVHARLGSLVRQRKEQFLSEIRSELLEQPLFR
jgi:CHAD domain-containing protein